MVHVHVASPRVGGAGGNLANVDRKGVWNANLHSSQGLVDALISRGVLELAENISLLSVASSQDRDVKVCYKANKRNVHYITLTGSTLRCQLCALVVEAEKEYD